MKKTIHSKEYGVVLRELRKAREDAGISQIELAKRLRSTQSIVSKCERGERRLDIIELWRWLDALECGLSEFSKTLESQLRSRRRK